MVQPTRPWPKPHRTPQELLRYQIQMAQSELKRRTANLWDNFWWKFIGHTEVDVRWPVGWAVLHENEDGSKVSTESADPNDHFRPWLEKNVGKQGRDWQWRIGSIAADNGNGTVGYDTVRIKFAKKHAHFASIVALKWA
jgi:hypothetical protein